MIKRISLFALMIILVLLPLASILFYFEKINYMIYAIGVVLVGTFISWLFSKIMAKSIMKVEIINPKKEEKHIVEEFLLKEVKLLSEKYGLKKVPQIGLYASNEVNSFSVGPTKANSLIALSTGLLNNMDANGLRGVIAHELSHIKNGDMVTMVLLQGVANTCVVSIPKLIEKFVSKFTNKGNAEFLSFLIGLIFNLLFMVLGGFLITAFSRLREFEGDKESSQIVGKEVMIKTLEVLQLNMKSVDKRKKTLNNYKINSGKVLFPFISSHPSLEKRIQRMNGK